MSKLRLPLARAPSRVCILRLSALGDVTHVLPVLRAMQAAWPETEITWICGRFEHKLLQAVEGVRFVLFDKNKGLGEYVRIRRLLKGESFDVLLHMQVALRANLLSALIKADVRLGWDATRSRDLHSLFINCRVPEAYRQHQVQGFLSFARTMGINVSEPQWDFPVTEQGLAFAEKYIDPQRKTLVISPCSSHPARNWTIDGYVQVAKYAADELGMQVILSGGPGDLEVATGQSIEDRSGGRVMNLIGKDTLLELPALLAAADVVISPDSGPAHIANAVGSPVIGLHACTWSLRSGPYSSLQHCVDKFDLAAQQFRNRSVESLKWGTRIEDPGVMELISPEDVIEKLRNLAS